MTTRPQNDYMSALKRDRLRMSAPETLPMAQVGAGNAADGEGLGRERD